MKYESLPASVRELNRDAGSVLNAPYSADYLFYKRAGDAT